MNSALMMRICKDIEMKKILLIITTALLAMSAAGQTKSSAARQQQVLEQVDKAARGMTTMQCDFTQTKHMKMLKRDMVSKGVMYFRQPDKLRWQYTSPYDYTFILNGDKVKIKSAKSTKDIDVEGNKMFRRITDIILGSITGNGLKSTTDFNVEIYEGPEGCFARLLPKKKELKQIYKLVNVHFNADLTMVSRVEMEEKTGDTTVIQLTGAKTNTEINEAQFSTR